MSNPQSDSNKFPFKEEVVKKFKKWLQIDDQEIDEALVELTGDTYFEMRKLISMVLNHVEGMITTDKYDGYVEGNKLTAEEKSSIKEVREDLKEFLRTTIEGSWRAILNKQRMGVDKLGIALKQHIKTEDNGEDSPKPTDSDE